MVIPTSYWGGRGHRMCLFSAKLAWKTVVSSESDSDLQPPLTNDYGASGPLSKLLHVIPVGCTRLHLLDLNKSQAIRPIRIR